MFSLQGSSTVMDNGSLTTQPPIGLYQVYTFVWSKSFEACHRHQVPDGWYVAPGLGWGGLRKENASDDNIERVLLIRVQTQTNNFFFTTPHWKMIKVNIFRHYKLLHKLQKWLEHMPNHTLLTRGDSPLVNDCRFGPCCQCKPYLNQKKFSIKKPHDRWKEFFKPFKTWLSGNF